MTWQISEEFDQDLRLFESRYTHQDNRTARSSAFQRDYSHEMLRITSFWTAAADSRTTTVKKKL